MPIETPKEPSATMEPTDAGRMAAETDPVNVHNLLRERLLPSTIRRAWEGSRYYRQLYDRAGIDPQSILTLSDLQRLPIVNKQAIREAGRDARCLPETTRV